MATRVIDDTKLNDIAVAIQAKDSGGQMTVDEMPTRIEALPTNLISKTITENGVYNATDDNADGYSDVTVAVPREITKLVDGTITEYVDDEVTEIRGFTFRNCTSLQKCLIPNVTEIKNASFYGCTSLTDFDFSNVQIMSGEYLFYDVPLKKGEPMRFPKLETVGNNCFKNMEYAQTPVRMAIYPKLTSIASSSFTASTPFKTIALLIFKQPVILTSYDVEMFSIRNSAIPQAKIYVPQALLNHFQTATNWSAGYADYPNVIRTIEDNVDYLVSLGFSREELLREDEVPT